MASEPPLALITGASSGIGLAIARILGTAGHRLHLNARPSDRFDQAIAELAAGSPAGVEHHADDLTDTASVQRLHDSLGGRIPDVLVNNAGFGTHGPFAESDPQSQSDLITVNISALIRLTRLTLPGMIARKSGRVLNVSSTASFQPGPYMASYYASKAFVTSFSRAIAFELRHSGVTVTTLCPGPTTTDFQNRAGVAETPLFRQNLMTAEDVARIGVEAMQAGRPQVICGVKNKLLAFSTRFAPTALATAIAGRMNGNRGSASKI